MPDNPMTPERIAEIRELGVTSCDPDCPHDSHVMDRALNECLAEVERLRAESERISTANALLGAENVELRSALHVLRHPLGRPKA